MPFDVYLLMIVVMIFSIHIPAFVPTLLQPMADANSFCSVFMVGMLMDLPRTGKDVGSVLRVLGWRLPLGVLFAAACWFLLPFDASGAKDGGDAVARAHGRVLDTVHRPRTR